MIQTARGRMEALSVVDTHPYWVTSLYLDLSPQARVGTQYLIAFKNLEKKARARLATRDLPSEVRDSLEEDLRKIEQYLVPDNLKGMRGIAIFSSNGKGLFEVFALPMVYRNRLVQDPTPYIRQLRAIIEDFRPTVLLLIDRTVARVFFIGLSAPQEVADYIYPGGKLPPKFHEDEGPNFKGRTVGSSALPAHGYGEHKFQRKEELVLHKHYSEVNRKLLQLLTERPFDRLVIAGPKGEVEVFKAYLHPYLSSRLVGVFHRDVRHISPAELQDLAYEAIEEAERRDEVRLVEEWKEKMPSGWAVAGVDAVLKALFYGQVRTLLVNEDYGQPGFRCPEGLLAVDRKSLEEFCPADQILEVEDVVDDALEQAIDMGSQVNILRHPETKEVLPDLGAILRYRIG